MHGKTVELSWFPDSTHFNTFTTSRGFYEQQGVHLLAGTSCVRTLPPQLAICGCSNMLKPHVLHHNAITTLCAVNPIAPSIPQLGKHGASYELRSLCIPHSREDREGAPSMRQPLRLQMRSTSSAGSPSLKLRRMCCCAGDVFPCCG